MDRNAPDTYCEANAASSLHDTELLIKWFADEMPSRIQPAITPRFVPTCSIELLRGLGVLAKKYKVLVTSHMSESDDMVSFVAALHPEKRDCSILQEAGILSAPSAIMAHCTHLTDEELHILANQGGTIAHCPLSNFFFADRSLRLRHVMRQGVRVSLGTDVAGGYSPSMLSAMRAAVLASRCVVHAEKMRLRSCLTPSENATQKMDDEERIKCSAEEHGLTYKQAFWLATIGGADAIGMRDSLGSFSPGKLFDALEIDLSTPATFDRFDTDSLDDLFQKFINLGDDRNIRRVWVEGNEVTQRI